MTISESKLHSWNKHDDEDVLCGTSQKMWAGVDKLTNRVKEYSPKSPILKANPARNPYNQSVKVEEALKF